jgi:filamentous hemagglutinin family protein
MAGMNRLILGILSAALAATCALANPTGGAVTSGAATIQQNGNTLQITTSTPSTSINWQSFSIGTGETTNITQPSTSSVTLNHVTTQSTSQILGSLTSNGQVFLINPNGVVFGAGVQINTAALNVTASSVSFGSSISFNDTTMTVTGQGFSGGPVTLVTNAISGPSSLITGTTSFTLTGTTTYGMIGVTTFSSGGVFVSPGGSGGSAVITTAAVGGGGSGTVLMAAGTTGQIAGGGGAPSSASGPVAAAGASQQSALANSPAGFSGQSQATSGAKVMLVKQEPVY